MDMGVALPTKANSWEVVVRAEQLGFSHAWFYDTPLLNAEMFAAMGAAAVKTSKIKLGSGVMVPSLRFAPVAASGFATLNALAPGRIVFGVSTGFTGRATMGLRPLTLARMTKYIKVVNGLLAGETVDWDEEGGTHKIRFLNPDLGLINIDDEIPVAISALGPKARALVADLGVQWINTPSHPDRDSAEMADMQALWRDRGRDLKDLHAIAALSGRVLDEGEAYDSPKALAQAGPGASMAFHAMIEQTETGAHQSITTDFPFPAELEAYRKIYETYEPADARYLQNHRGHLMFLRPEETHVTGPVIKALTATGSKAELVERIQRLKELGYEQIQLHLRPGQEDDMMERWADVMAAV